MTLPDKPSVVTPDLDLLSTFGGTIATYTAPQLSNGYGIGTPLGQILTTTQLNYLIAYMTEWIKYASDSLDAIDHITGTHDIADTDTTETVTFASAQPDTDYNIILTPVKQTGTPTTNSYIAYISNKTVNGFDITSLAAPSAGATVRWNWLLVR
jgi:hypothetical protein